MSHKDANVLRVMYHELELSIPMIAAQFDVSISTIWKYMEDHGIERQVSPQEKPPQLKSSSGGYEFFETEIDGKYHSFAHHRLLALLKYEIKDLAGSHVHHRNGIPWDNRLENLEIMSPTEHRRHHMKEWKRERGQFTSQPMSP